MKSSGHHSGTSGLEALERCRARRTNRGAVCPEMTRWPMTCDPTRDQVPSVPRTRNHEESRARGLNGFARRLRADRGRRVGGAENSRSLVSRGRQKRSPRSSLPTLERPSKTNMTAVAASQRDQRASDPPAITRRDTGSAREDEQTEVGESLADARNDLHHLVLDDLARGTAPRVVQILDRCRHGRSRPQERPDSN